METLLAHSFDYLSSCDQQKIRKGLRQVEGLMAQICLSKPSETAEEQLQQQQHHQQQQQKGRDRRSKRHPSALVKDNAPSPAKSLEELRDDPAFLEWFKLQDNFQWNAQLDTIILSTLDVIQGSLLLHPSSRALFARENNMNLLLDLLEPTNSPQVQCATLFTLVSALMCHPASIRCFEELDGLLTITSLFKLRATRKEVKVRLVEFLYFYLMPETGVERTEGEDSGIGSGGSGKGSGSGNVYGRKGRRSAEGSGRSSRSITGRNTRTLEEKKIMLGKYLNNVDDLVSDLRETLPFASG
ncbi:hypothetical protein KEM56_006633 [Ascosphaera pollenicola]|nr:hypothetical protein KEM56_006633 [Ascosphaera pollenicola]